MMTGTRGFKCVVAAALAVMVCLPLGGCGIEIKGGKRNDANTGNALLPIIKDGKWHTGSNGYGGSDSSSYRYVDREPGCRRWSRICAIAAAPAA